MEVRVILQAHDHRQETPIGQEILVHLEERDKVHRQVPGLQILIEEVLQDPILIEAEVLRHDQAQVKWEAVLVVWEAVASEAEAAEEEDKRRFL